VSRYDTPVPLIEDDALVLDTHPFRDRHLIVAMLTRKRGLVRAVFREARGGKAPKAAAAQTLSLVHLTAYQGPHAELATIRQMELRKSSFPVSSEIDRAAAAAVVAELLVSFCPPGDPAPRRFRLGVALLDSLLAGGDPATITSYAQFWVLRLSGVFPPLEETTLSEADLEFLGQCRTKALAALSLSPSQAVSAWLDEKVRLEADRPLLALDFFRTAGVDVGDS
jgi:DNA repair protein RecO